MSSPQPLVAWAKANGPRLTQWAFPPKLGCNNTRQGYALRSTLKPAGYFFVRGVHALH